MPQDIKEKTSQLYKELFNECISIVSSFTYKVDLLRPVCLDGDLNIQTKTGEKINFKHVQITYFDNKEEFLVLKVIIPKRIHGRDYTEEVTYEIHENEPNYDNLNNLIKLHERLMILKNICIISKSEKVNGINLTFNADKDKLNYLVCKNFSGYDKKLKLGWIPININIEEQIMIAEKFSEIAKISTYFNQC